MATSDDPRRRPFGEALLAPASATQPGLHDFIGIGFSMVFNGLVIAAICWMALWLCWVALTLVQRLRKAS